MRFAFAIVAAFAAHAASAAITAQPLVGEDVLEPSVVHEVEHALARGEEALLRFDAAAESADVSAFAGLKGTPLALRLVSAQRADGRWLSGTNDITYAVTKLLRDLIGDDPDLPTGCPEFTVEGPRPDRTSVVRAADYGFSPTNDRNAEAINAALAAARRLGAGRLELAPGEYRCFDGPGVLIDGFEDFTFDGMGATLVFRRDHAPLERQETLLDGEANVVIRNCRRTEVRGFNLDWDWRNDPLAVWCVCTGKHVDEADNASYADFELDAPHPKHPAPVPVQLLTPMAADRRGARHEPRRGPRCYFGMCLGHQGAKMEWLSPTRLRLWPYVKPVTGFLAKENENRYSAKGNRDAVRGIDVGGTFTLSHRYYGLNGIEMDSNRHLTLRDIDIWACWGLGVETRGAQKHWQLVNVNVRPRPGRLYPVTSTADAHHVVQSQGFGKMIGCETTMNQDDHFNYHDRTQIARTVGPRTLEVVNNRGVAYTLFKPGTTVALRRDDFSSTGWRGRIVAIEGERIAFDRDLPPQNGLLFVMTDTDYATENFLFRDCRFHDTPWSRGICQGNNITFDGCVFGPMTGTPLKITSCYTFTAWCEGIGATNVVVRNCRFENCLDNATGGDADNAQIHVQLQLAGKDYWPLGYIPVAHPGFAKTLEAVKASGAWPKPSSAGVDRILVEDNVFVNPRGYLLSARNVGTCILRGNRVIRTDAACAPLPFAGRIREAH